MSIPVLIKRSSGIISVSIEAKHMSERRLFITGEISSDTAVDFMKQMMYLNAEGDSPISIFINTPGGEINSGMLMYDVIVGSKAPIRTYCTGVAYSMGAVLFACAKERYMLPNSELMIHQPLLGGRVSGNASTIKSVSDSLLEIKEKMNKILALHTGRTIEEVNEQTSYDHFFTAEEAIHWGLCDGIKNFSEMMGE